MKRRIRIGYAGHHNSWEQILGQIGVDWERIEPGHSVSIQEYSCLIIDRSPDRTERSSMEDYLKDGGAVLDCNGSLLPQPVHSRSLSVITTSNSEKIFGHIEDIPVFGKVTTQTSAGSLDGAVWIDPSPNRNLAFFGLPVSRLWHEYKTIHRPFRSSDSTITAERSSALRSRPYLDVILALLKILHNRADLPFVHKWWHPHSSKQVATLRIDSDYADSESIRSVSNTAKASDIPLTWFLHAGHHEPYLDDLIRGLPDRDEIALHCYRHNEYRTAEQYISDIQSGIKCLQRTGVSPEGYAAPYGNWSGVLAEVLAHFPFRYTSEFSYDFDSLPSISPSSGVLQLPVHPVTIGSFRRFRLTPSKILTYFKELIQLSCLMHQPLHLYHHPLDGSPNLWKELIKQLPKDDYVWMRYSDWSKWWKRRSASVSTTVFDTDTKELQPAHQGKRRTLLAIHMDGNFHVRSSDTHPIHLDRLTFRPYIATELKQLIKDRRAASSFSRFKLMKDEILTGLWRNRV